MLQQLHAKMLSLLAAFFLSNFLFFEIESVTHYTKIYQSLDSFNRRQCLILSQDILQKDTLSVHKDSFPAKPDSVSDDFPNILEIYSPLAKPHQLQNEINESCDYYHNPELSPTISGRKIPETSVQQPKILRQNIVKLFDGGDPKNRVDIVFMGDGYKEEERNKFLSDINRLVEESLKSSTTSPFSEFLPLMNIWAIFTPSKDSGISYPQKRKNTVFKLYRKSGAFRGVFLQNRDIARSVCRTTGLSACDYPVIIGNDDYYGGIGGEFATSTSSVSSGSMVLRHELGHNFARVGEEYDKGEVYSGANSASSLKNLSWRKWLNCSNQSQSNNGRESCPREERIVYKILSFPQNDLDKKAQSYSFSSDGTYGGWFLTLTLAGASEDDDVQFFLDGQQLAWSTSGTLDKSIYSWTNSSQGLSKGKHNLTIVGKQDLREVKPKPVLKSLGAVYFYEFGDENSFSVSNEIISAYPTWNVDGRKSYRPTNNGCLMRNMSHNQLCSVCKESVWLQFLKKVSLIDEFSSENISINNSTLKKVSLKVVALGQFKTIGKHIEGERLEINWIKDGIVQKELENKLSIEAGKGAWSVGVRLITPQIRNDPKQLTLDKKSFIVR